MDDATLDLLAAAVTASPDNFPLLQAVLTELVARGDFARAASVLHGVKDLGALAPDALRLLAARALVGAGDPARALPLVDAISVSSGEALLLRARALLALERREEGAKAYREAVAQNPALEDLDLRAQLDSRVREVDAPSATGPRLRVIANDDTDRDEVQRLLEPQDERVTFAAVGGHEELKRQIHKRIILPFQKPSLFERFRKRAGGGILLYGPPGCGKTLLARATAGECNAAFFNVAISDVLDMYIGESERKLHALFEKARSSAPAVLFFDELEALAGKRQFTREAASSKLVSQFLSEMDGFARNNSGVLILGATNVPWAVDPAFRRPGRFDRVLFVPPPDAAARREILRLQLAGRPTDPAADLEALARKTSGFTGADLMNLVESAADNAIERSLGAAREVPIDQSDLERASAEVKPTSAEWLTTARNYARYANESGQYDEVLEFLQRNGKA